MITNTISNLIPIIRGLVKDQERNDGRNVYEYDNDNGFTLSEPFINADSIVVYVNGEAISTEDFTFDTDTNKVMVDFNASGDSLETDDIILITYSYYKKYSDTEVEGYIFAALTYFVQYRYKKIFEIDDGELIAINDEVPTINELYFICLVSGILIDPQNIEIDIAGNFKITANRNKSDQEQIKEAFFQFTRFVGEFTFNIIEDCE